MAIILERWGPGFVYSASKKLDHQVTGADVEDVMARIVRTQSGLCNISATGLISLLRAVGVVANYRPGILVDERGVNTHAVVEFWDGNKWREIEPQQRVFEGEYSAYPSQTAVELVRAHSTAIQRFARVKTESANSAWRAAVRNAPAIGIATLAAGLAIYVALGAPGLSSIRAELYNLPNDEEKEKKDRDCKCDNK